MDAKVETDNLKILFDKATAYVRTIAGNLSSERLLYLYGRFKQVIMSCYIEKYRYNLKLQ